MKLESLKLKRFQRDELNRNQMDMMSSFGNRPCPNEQTGSASTIHSDSDGATSHVNYAYDVIRWRARGHTTFHGLTNVHLNGGACQYL